jgi:hypothetical protein
VNPDTPNVLQAMMKLEQVKPRAKTTNKVALETEKEKDTIENSGRTETVTATKESMH